MDSIRFRCASRRQCTRRAFGPHVDVMLRVADDCLLARRAGRRMNAHQLILGNGEQAKGIIIPQILLDGKGKLYDIVDCFDIPWQQADLIEFLFVKRHMIVCVMYHLNQPGRLERPEILP